MDPPDAVGPGLGNPRRRGEAGRGGGGYGESIESAGALRFSGWRRRVRTRHCGGGAVSAKETSSADAGAQISP